MIKEEQQCPLYVPKPAASYWMEHILSSFFNYLYMELPLLFLNYYIDFCIGLFSFCFGLLEGS